MSRPVALDYTAAMLTGAGRGVDLRLLAEMLPRVEAAILSPPDNANEPEADDDDA